MNMSRFLILLVVFFGRMVIGTLAAYHKVADISTAPVTLAPKSVREVRDGKPSFSIGVISRYAPSRIYRIYQPLVDYLSLELGCRIELKLSKDYEETVRQLTNGEVLVAFLGSYIYAKARLEHQLQPIVSPLNAEGKPFTRAALVVPIKSDLHSIRDLKNHSLALPSKDSYSANWLKQSELTKYDLDFHELKTVQHFDFHHTVIFQVLWGNFDAGVVRESVAEEFRAHGILVLEYSNEFPSPPLVSLKNADPQLIAGIKEVLLKLKQKSITPLGFTGFAEARDESYDRLSRIFFH